MANNIVLKTYRGGSVTPLDDAIIQQTVIATNGIFKGCNVTYARGNVLHVSQGFGMIKGRFFEVYDCEVGVILNSGSGTLQGRLYIHMDLSNADEPIQLLTETASVLTDLTGDEDVNYNNTAYDLELATFGVTRTGITNLVPTFEKITGASGSGGASSLQRSTAYYVGDFVTCKNAPGWVTLYCTTAGETTATEPVEYAGLAQVGDTVQDGTCVFIARDVVGEIDVLKDLFTDTETSIAGLEDGLQELWEEVIKQAESQDDPIGTIRFMPSTNADEVRPACLAGHPQLYEGKPGLHRDLRVPGRDRGLPAYRAWCAPVQKAQGNGGKFRWRMRKRLHPSIRSCRRKALCGSRPTAGCPAVRTSSSTALPPRSATTHSSSPGMRPASLWASMPTGASPAPR